MKILNLILLVGLGLFCLSPLVPSAAALLLGVALAVTLGNPFPNETKKLAGHLLSLSVVGLGFGMNLIVVGQVGFRGIGYTIIGISLTLAAGILLGRLLRNQADISLLITVGTAICGGSAIAAVSSVIKAKSHDITVALGTVFLLNALALLIFPPLGHYFQLSEYQFGLWSALAIHDTSSVVGATLKYGPHAVEVGTTIKLARALWIVPVALGIGFVRARQNQAAGGGSFKKPWFILGFVLAAALVTWVPALGEPGHWIEFIAKRTLVLTLFLIGAGLSRATLKAVGMRPFVQGLVLWIVVSTSTLFLIASGLLGDVQ